MPLDSRNFAVYLGRRLAENTTNYSATLEAKITQSPIYPHPVPLEPPFRPFDPLQTFEHAGPVPVPSAEPGTKWLVRRIILTKTDSIDYKHAESTLAALAGSKTPITFELWATRHTAGLYLGAPLKNAGLVLQHWRTAYPECPITNTPDPANDLRPDNLVVCDLYSPAPYHRSIRLQAQTSPWRYLLSACDSLKEGETVFAQIIFAPTKNAWQQNIAALLQAESLLGPRAPMGRTANPKRPDEPIFAAAIRIGTTQPSLAAALESFTGTFSADGKPFRYRTTKDFGRVLDATGMVAMIRERTTHTSGQLLTTSELATFVHHPDTLPGGRVQLVATNGLPVPKRRCENGFPLGTNNYNGAPLIVRQPNDQHNKNNLHIGLSRKGKSTLLLHRCRHLALTGQGVGLIDPHRTTAFDLLGMLGEAVSPERVVFLDFDAPTPVAYNPFAHDDEEEFGRLTNEYVNSFKHLLGAEGFHRMNHILGMSLYALFVLSANVATIPELLSPSGEGLRRRVATLAKNDTVRRFWTDEYKTYTKDAFTPLTNRLSALLLDDKTQRTFCQEQNKIDIARIMDEQQVLIIAPPASIESASLVGGMLIGQAKHAAFRRAGTPRAARHFHLGIDEFHRFITSAHSLQSIIDETSKGGLSVSLANQETGQIPADLLKAVLSVPNIFVFGVNLPDAKLLAPLFSGSVTPDYLTRQRTGEVCARIDGEITTFVGTPPTPYDPDLAERLIAHSTQTYYARPAEPNPRRAGRTIENFPED
ncbi:MAG TPA: hypothetical protein VGK29_03145 [Paludibaculum sp.]|jgi:hypothetical protein